MSSGKVKVSNLDGRDYRIEKKLRDQYKIEQAAVQAELEKREKAKAKKKSGK